MSQCVSDEEIFNTPSRISGVVIVGIEAVE